MSNYKKIAMACALLVALAGGWYIFAGRNDVHDIGERADETRSELGSAREEQRDQAAALDRATDAADRSQQAIRDSQESAGRIEDVERSDAEIIRDCKSIIASVRSRGKAENQNKG